MKRNKKMNIFTVITLGLIFCVGTAFCDDINTTDKSVDVVNEALLDNNASESNTSLPTLLKTETSNPFQKRFVFFDRSIEKDENLALAKKVVRDAKRLGFNGLVFSQEYLFSRLSHKNAIVDKAKENISALESFVHENGLEFIMMHFSAEVPNTVVHDANPDNSFYQEGKFDFSEANKAVSIYKVSGEYATFQGLSQTETSPALLDRLYHFTGIKPNTEYRLTLEVSTENFSGDSVKVSVLDEDHKGENGKVLFGINKYFHGVEATKSHAKHVIYFNSLDHENTQGAIKVYLSHEGSGLKVDSLTLDEVGYTSKVHVVRPDTTPLVMSESGDKTYHEGLDYHLNDDGLILMSGAIKSEPRLRVVWYPVINTSLSYDHETNADMCADEALYKAIMIDQYREVKSLLKGDIDALAFNDDEWREAGWNVACKKLYNRELNSTGVGASFTGGDYIGITTQRTIDALLEEVNSTKMNVYLMSDMFDPNFNAKTPYMGVHAGAEGALKYLNPQNAVMFNWFVNPYEPGLEDKTAADFLASAKYFSDHNFSQIIAGYHDDMRNVDANIAVYKDSPKKVQESIVGFMFLIWHQPGKTATYDDMEGVVKRLCKSLPNKWPGDVCRSLDVLSNPAPLVEKPDPLIVGEYTADEQGFFAVK